MRKKSTLQVARRQARIIALKVIFENSLVNHNVEDIIYRYFSEEKDKGFDQKFAEKLIYGALNRKEEIDSIISQLAPAWPIDQMSYVDLAILRIAIFELLYDNSDTSSSIVISEAVEISKTYGSESSFKLINGILGNAISLKSGKI